MNPELSVEPSFKERIANYPILVDKNVFVDSVKSFFPSALLFGTALLE